MRRRKSWALILALALLLTGCSRAPSEAGTPTISPSASPGIEQDTQITLSMPLNAATLSPFAVKERETAHVLALIYEGLVRLDENGLPTVALAESWEMSEDGKEWTFTLRSGVVFHDGTPLSAADVAYSYQQVKLNPDCRYYDGLENVSSVTDSGGGKVTVRLNKPDYTALFAMTFPVVRRGTVSYSAPNGTGPYRVSEKTAQGMTLTANGEWWRKQGAIRAIRVSFAENEEASVGAFLSGQTDVAYVTAVTWGEAGVTDQDYRVMRLTTGQYEYVAFNFDNPLLADLQMRRALSCAVNRQELVSSVYHGSADKAATPVAACSAWCDATVEGADYDPAAAADILEQLGYRKNEEDGLLYKNGEALTFKLVVNETSDNVQRRNAGQYISAQLAALGVTVQIEEKGWEDYLKAIGEKDFDLAMAGTYLETGPDYAHLLGTGGKVNVGGFSSGQVDAAIEQVRLSGDNEALVRAARDLQQVISEEIPVIGLCFVDHTILIRNDILGVGKPGDFDCLRGIEGWYKLAKAPDETPAPEK